MSLRCHVPSCEESGHPVEHMKLLWNVGVMALIISVQLGGCIQMFRWLQRDELGIFTYLVLTAFWVTMTGLGGVGLTETKR